MGVFWREMIWTIKVTRDQPVVFETLYDLRITSACLGNFKVKNGERYVLSVTHVDFVEEENRTSPLCVFIGGQTEFVNLDLIADEGEPVSFSCTGDAVIHLSGYYMLNEEMDDEDDQDILSRVQDSILASSSDDEEFNPNDMSLDSVGDSDSEDDEDSDDEPKVEVLDDESAMTDNILEKVKQKTANLAKKRVNPPASSPPAKKTKTETTQSPKQQTPKKQEQTTPKKQEQATPKKQQNTPKKEQTTPKKQEQTTPKKQEQSPKNQQAATPKQQTTPQKGKPAATPSPSRMMKGGLKVDILTPSSNPATASKGKKITVKYVGRLAKNKKVFDQGKFSFPLGTGKVIRGWDLGLEGMPVGETRKLVIPPKLAYGSTAMDGIPANSTLEFEVTLLKA